MSTKTKLTIFVVLLIAVVAIIVWEGIIAAFFAYIFMAVVGCGFYEYGKMVGRSSAADEANANGKVVVAKPGIGKVVLGYGMCVLKVLLFPVRLAYQGARWLWKKAFDDDNNTTKATAH